MSVVRVLGGTVNGTNGEDGRYDAVSVICLLDLVMTTRWYGNITQLKQWVQ